MGAGGQQVLEAQQAPMAHIPLLLLDELVQQAQQGLGAARRQRLHGRPYCLGSCLPHRRHHLTLPDTFYSVLVLTKALYFILWFTLIHTVFLPPTLLYAVFHGMHTWIQCRPTHLTLHTTFHSVLVMSLAVCLELLAVLAGLSRAVCKAMSGLSHAQLYPDSSSLRSKLQRRQLCLTASLHTIEVTQCGTLLCIAAYAKG